MDIHKPKPVRNWREFLTEIGTIVIGVLIALAAEQAVEALHWRAQVAEAREVIATELAGNLRNSIFRMRTERCTERRLDMLAQILDTAAHSGALPPVGDIGLPSLFQWTSGAWDGVVASQTATHFPRQQLAELATIYGFVHKADSFNLAEANIWAELHTMVGPGRRLDPPDEARLRAALSLARYDNRTLTILGLRIVQRMEKQDMPFSKDDLDLIAAGKHRVLTANRYSICLPVGAVPAAYGQAPLTDLSEIDDGLKRLPDFVAR